MKDLKETLITKKSIKNIVTLIKNKFGITEKDLKEALITKKSIKNIVTSIKNKFGITEKDLVGDISKFPIGVVVRMLEEQEKQRNESDVRIFQKNNAAGFTWRDTEEGKSFWHDIIVDRKFDVFYKKYPEYKKYDAR